MGYWKDLFWLWRREKYPDIRLDDDQLEWLGVWFENHEHGETADLPKVEKKAILQRMIAEFWEDCRDR